MHLCCCWPESVCLRALTQSHQQSICYQSPSLGKRWLPKKSTHQERLCPRSISATTAVFLSKSILLSLERLVIEHTVIIGLRGIKKPLPARFTQYIEKSPYQNRGLIFKTPFDFSKDRVLTLYTDSV